MKANIHLKSFPLQLFHSGDSFFETLWHDLEHAQQAIWIEIYLWANDAIGKKLQSILMQKAKAGLDVRVIVDAIGSRDLNEVFINELKNSGVKFKRFNPLRLFNPIHLFTPSQWQINRRNHRKVVIIDQQIAFTGGINFHEKESEKSCSHKAWRDSGLRLEGPLAKQLAHLFLKTIHHFPSFSKRNPPQGIDFIAAVTNRFGRNSIRKFILRYVRRAKKEVFITTAYFVPDWETLFVMARALKRKTKITIITNSEKNSDVSMVPKINRPLIKFLIKRGAKVYYYKDRMIHAKTITFDNSVATLGSCNMNYRSFFRDLELNLFFHRKKVVHELKSQFKKDLQNSVPVTLEDLRYRSLTDRLVSSFFYLLRSFF